MKILIIPSAKLIEGSLQEKFGKIPSLMIPLDGKMALDYIYKKYEKYYDEICISGYEEYEKLLAVINNKKYPKASLYKLDMLRDISYSINYILKNKKIEVIDTLSINFGDTFVEKFDENYIKENLYLYNKTSEETMWTRFKKKNNKIEIIEKNEESFSKKENSFIGFFNIKDVNCFYNLLSIQSEKIVSVEKFYEVIQEFYKIKKVILFEEKNWIDFGHLDKYYQAKKIVAARCFNTIEIDDKKGTLIKKSTEKEKFLNEIKWYLKLPDDLQWLSPRIFKYSLSYENPYIEMEFYSYGTLHDLYLYGNHTPHKWDNIFNKLLDIQKQLKKYTLNLDKISLKKALEKIYVGKTLERLEKLKQNPNFKEYFLKNFKINNKIYKPLTKIIENMNDYCEKFEIYNVNSFNIIHGDYFFANILYDINFNIVRLIDPRGDFGGYGIYGDSYYELAKLSHSVDGMYDFIVEDLFEINIIDDLNFNYKISCTEEHLKIKEIFYNKFSLKEIKKIKFIQSLLFLSMIPLHYDKPDRQKIMLGVGLRLLDEIL